MTSPYPLRVVVAGGGIAALETVLGLRALAGDAVAVTVIAPGPEVVHRPETVGEPFGRPARRYPLRELVEALGATHVPGRVRFVDHGRHEVGLEDGSRPGYDQLVIAVGTRSLPVLPDAVTFRPETADTLRPIVADLEAGTISTVVLVAPRRCGWALPLYELALLLAARAPAPARVGPAAVTLVTSEPAPLYALRGAASDVVARRLEARGVRVLTGEDASRLADGRLVLHPGSAGLPADRVIALPVLTGADLHGLPLEHGFVRVGPEFAVPGHDGVYAVGDAADYPVKQGGLATQQADVVAAAIARAAGRDVPVRPYAGRLRVTFWTGEAPLYLSSDLIGGEPVASAAAERAPWWPTDKVAGARLAPFLLDVDEVGAAVAVRRADDRHAQPPAGGALLACAEDPGVMPLERTLDDPR